APWSQIWMADLASGRAVPWPGAREGSNARWSKDGSRIAFIGPTTNGGSGVLAGNADGTSVAALADVMSSNSPLPQIGERLVWSPDGRFIAYEGLKRPMTSSETNSEDTHVWTVDVGTGGRREVGAAVDNRQGAPQWSADGRHLFGTVQSQGGVGLFEFSPRDGAAVRVLPATEVHGTVTSFAVGKDGTAVYSMATPAAPAELYVNRTADLPHPVTTLNREPLAGKTMAEVESVRFQSFDGREIEAFLTRPARAETTGKHPMIVMRHGGPHGQQGPAFNHRAQVYAARGWAALMVNYRGSTGYGQKFSDAIARDQDGGEAKDVLAATEAVLARHPWI